jgi:transposase
MLGLPGFVVTTAGEYGGELELVVETTETVTGCPSCGVVATAHGRRPVWVRDTPIGDRPVVLCWRKRLWRCDEPTCSRRTWTETSPAIMARATLTERARAWAARRVGKDNHTVAEVARELAVGWRTVMSAVREVGTPLVDDPDRLDGVTALGVDEHVWQHADPRRPTGYATGIVDLTADRPARLLEVTKGRSGTVYAGWLAQRDQQWRDRIALAALDPFHGYAAALKTQLPAATRVLDAFHVVKLGLTALDEVRRRVQQEQTGHRGHKHDPLYQVRRLLRLGAEKLTDTKRAKLDAALAAGDPDWEVTIAWQAAQRLRAVYHAPTPAHGYRLAQQLLDELWTCPIPEIARLGRTLRRWRTEFLAYHHTGGASNGPSETINLGIEEIRRRARGFRNFDNYRLRLLLNLGVDWHHDKPTRIRSRSPRFVA